jgi:predicted metalloprotease with PDZ domain
MTIIFRIQLLFILSFCVFVEAQISDISSDPIRVTMDLIHVENDRVEVHIFPTQLESGPVRFLIPKTVPGTYSEDNYGRYVEQFKAFDRAGVSLSVLREGDNSWLIEGGQNLYEISYFVNDSYDVEGGIDAAPFSPAGTNILKDQNFMLNLHGFVGYFEGLKEIPFDLQVQAPDNLYPATSLPWYRLENGNYLFKANRYFEVIDNPIQFAEDPVISFDVDDITINLSVYSPNHVYSALDLQPVLERMMRAQRTFLGDIGGTETYTILLYLSVIQEDAIGFGALEHHTSTVVVLPEQMPAPQLEEAMIDVVSHEFFHTVTPLNVHSEEIQFFDYNNPKMSKHLWMYEGTTEYFANLFQIKEGLIDEAEFYRRLYTKIMNATGYNDSLSFTEMSSKVLEEPYADEYGNVYEKGALINMSLDILLRSLSDGAFGVLDLMRDLSNTYDANTPFQDAVLFDEIVTRTYPEVSDFFDTYVSGNTPINYNEFLERVGLSLGEVEVACGHFLTDMESAIPFIDVNPSNNDEIFIREGIILNSFLMEIGAKEGDVLNQINGVSITLESMRNVIIESLSWQPDSDITMLVTRNGKSVELKGKAGMPTYLETRIAPLENATEVQLKLRDAWLKR